MPETSPHFSFVNLLINADPVVKAVMAVLVLASVLSWGLSFETIRRQIRLRRFLQAAAAAGGLAAAPVLAQTLLIRGRQSADIAIAGETGGEYRGRIERAMREVAAS